MAAEPDRHAIPPAPAARPRILLSLSAHDIRTSAPPTTSIKVASARIMRRDTSGTEGNNGKHRQAAVFHPAVA
ncbi:hypothetical protein [Paracoccus sp. ME4]|uniref:hypothetical protein n=1 Tax=Paracoccus sp. ME4 TaxID=3138066 RepID=UPI00398A65CC